MTKLKVIYSVIQKKGFHIPPGSSDSNNRDCQSFLKLSNGNLQNVLWRAVIFFVNAIVEFEECLPECLAASIILVGRSRGGVKTLLWITK